MVDSDSTPFAASGRARSPMFEVLEAIGEDVVAVRVGAGTPAGYEKFYDLLVEVTDEYGTVHVYEEAPDWTATTYLSHLYGVLPDLRTGPAFDVGRYAAVGDSAWVTALYYQWKAIAPVWHGPHKSAQRIRWQRSACKPLLGRLEPTPTVFHNVFRQFFSSRPLPTSMNVASPAGRRDQFDSSPRWPPERPQFSFRDSVNSIRG